MRLQVATPLSVVVDADDVRSMHAEDATGSFGILPGHADFVTVLAISVVSWHDAADAEHHIAVRGGVLRVHDGAAIEIATREAVGEDTLERLGAAVLDRFREEQESDEAARTSAGKLQIAALRQLQRYLDAGRQPVAGQPTAPRSGEFGG